MQRPGTVMATLHGTYASSSWLTSCGWIGDPSAAVMVKDTAPPSVDWLRRA